MTRIYRPKLDCDSDNIWQWPAPTAAKTLNVAESEETPSFSGLLDANGNKLMVHVQRDPIGFVRLRERS